MKNKYFEKYFLVHEIFHDCFVKNINFDSRNGVLKMIIYHYDFMPLLKTKNVIKYVLLFKNIHAIKFVKKPLAKMSLKYNITIKEYFNKGYRLSEFLYMYLSYSRYNDFSKKYFNKECYKADIELANGQNIEAHFLDFEVIEPEIMKKYNVEKLRALHRKSWGYDKFIGNKTNHKTKTAG